MAVKTREEMVKEIMSLELEAKSYEALQGKNIYSNDNFPKYLKVLRKLQKLRDQL